VEVLVSRQAWPGADPVTVVDTEPPGATKPPAVPPDARRPPATPAAARAAAMATRSAAAAAAAAAAAKPANGPATAGAKPANGPATAGAKPAGAKPANGPAANGPTPAKPVPPVRPAAAPIAARPAAAPAVPPTLPSAQAGQGGPKHARPATPIPSLPSLPSLPKLPSVLPSVARPAPSQAVRPVGFVPMQPGASAAAPAARGFTGDEIEIEAFVEIETEPPEIDEDTAVIELPGQGAHANETTGELNPPPPVADAHDLDDIEEDTQSHLHAITSEAAVVVSGTINVPDPPTTPRSRRISEGWEDDDGA
jgi:hypothetical protein